MSTSVKTEFYSLEIPSLNGEKKIRMADYKGKKILIVNVASKCGFTPQYEGLQKLNEEFSDTLQIIGFPCNQFLWQEPGGPDKIAEFCQLNYGVTFPLTEKIKVKGSGKHPIYNWLTSKELNGKDNYKVSWNFHKFLLDENGNLLEHFGSKITPYDEKILQYLH